MITTPIDINCYGIQSYQIDIWDIKIFTSIIQLLNAMWYKKYVKTYWAVVCQQFLMLTWCPFFSFMPWLIHFKCIWSDGRLCISHDNDICCKKVWRNKWRNEKLKHATQILRPTPLLAIIIHFSSLKNQKIWPIMFWRQLKNFTAKSALTCVRCNERNSWTHPANE